MSFQDCINQAVARNLLKDGKAKEALELFDEVEAELRAQGYDAAKAEIAAAKQVSERLSFEKIEAKKRKILQVGKTQEILDNMRGYKNLSGESDFAKAAQAMLDSDPLAGYSNCAYQAAKDPRAIPLKISQGPGNI